MKKLIILIATLCVATGLVSCELDIAPKTAIPGSEAAQLKYVEGLRAGVYNDMTTITSPAYTLNDEYQSDLFVQTNISGNRGGYFHRWELYEDDQDVRGQWYAYYSVISSINYALGKCAATEAESDEAKAQIAFYEAELHFFRAYMFDLLALHFCEPYDSAKAATLPGIPCPTAYAPGTSIGRGTLKGTYDAILADLKVAEAGIKTTGSANASFLTADAVTAFKARIALQMKKFDDAIGYASSLYAKYPLVTSKDALGQMWTSDLSTETILQFSVTTTTLKLVSSMVSDFTDGTWIQSQSRFIYKPADVPCQWVANLYDDADWRKGTYVEVCPTEKFGDGLLLVKLLGNTSLRTKQTSLNYANMPKMFRIAEMYLIEAEAQYFDGGDAAAPLNTLRAKRGLPATTKTGADLLQEIKDEYVREFIGEGMRMSCLKRWGDGFTRDVPDFVKGKTAGGSTLSIQAKDHRFTWPIPQMEIQNNAAINAEDQNKGY